MARARGRILIRLNPREFEIVSLLCQGVATKVASNRLNISYAGLHYSVSTAKRKANAKTLEQLCCMFGRGEITAEVES